MRVRLLTSSGSVRSPLGTTNQGRELPREGGVVTCLERLTAVDESPLQNGRCGRILVAAGGVQGIDDGEGFDGWAAASGGRGGLVGQELLQGDTQDVGRAHQHGEPRVLLAFPALDVLHPPLGLSHELTEVGLGEASQVAPVGNATADARSVHMRPHSKARTLRASSRCTASTVVT